MSRLSVFILASTLVGGLAHAWQPPPFFPHVETFEGTLTAADYERYLERTFVVPAGHIVASKWSSA
ncbi:MAG: hypothetical protein R2712_24850 [Vicinamibacterales bacterium]